MNIKRVKSLASVLALITACQGCASGPRFPGAVHLVSSADIEIESATARQNLGGIRIAGDVRRTNGYAGTFPGHLHVTGRDAAGHVVAVTDVNWGEFMNRRFRLAYYKAFLEVGKPSSVASIDVEVLANRLP
ncbi:MAG: hypothetical protein H0X36_06875 [Sphingomonadaceae bacterium]|nr:hypothetical protein [Sphingomonadaceae bacterium]